MIRFLEHKQIEKNKWDACIQLAVNGMVYANSWYLDIVSPGWNALVAGDYAAVLPLTWRKKYGFHYLCQPFFTQQLGIFMREKNQDEKTVQYFLDAIPQQYRLIEIQLNTTNSLSQGNFETNNRLTHHLELNKPHATLQSAYTENLKRNLKRAANSRLEISSGITIEEIITLFKKHKAKTIQSLKNKDYELLEGLVHEARRKKQATLLGVKLPSGKWCAGAVFLHSFHEYIFLFSAVNEVARETGAMSLLIDHFIGTHANEDKVLDFEGSMNKNLARFYKSFGSKEIVYLQIRKNELPSYIRWMKN